MFPSQQQGCQIVFIICFNVAFCYTGLWLPPEVNSLLAFWPQQSQTIYLPGQQRQLQQQRRPCVLPNPPPHAK